MKGKKQPNPKQTTLHINVDIPWFQDLLPKDTDKINGDDRLIKEIESLYESEVANYRKKHSLGKSDEEWYNSIMQSGTFKDKVSAIALRIRSSPAHSVEYLNQLLGLSKKKSRKDALMAIEALKDLFTSCVLPDRKLKYFKFQAKAESAKEKLLGYFEHQLKTIYFEYIKILEALAMDPLYFVKYKAMNFLYELLVAKPEQEQNLLTLIVNKIGDPENKLASRASYLLGQMLLVHPSMKLIVIKEVEQLVTVKKINDHHAKYYGIIFMNQIIMTRQEKEVANYLVQFYFSIFRKLMAKKEDLNDQESKLLSAIMTGVNRAFPFTDVTQIKQFEESLDTLFKLARVGNFSTSLQTMSLIFQISANQVKIQDRFYKTLYELLFDPRLNISESKLAIFFNILYKALEQDGDMKRVQAILKRLFQICSFHQPPFICSSLLMFSKLLVAKPGLYMMLDQNEDLGADEEKYVDKDEENEDKDNDKSQEHTVGLLCAGYPYNYEKRDPRHANAEKTIMWELQILRFHFHPTVALYAESIINKKPLECEADPLQTFTITAFLERFVQKNAKVTTEERGTSLMQPRESTLKFVDASEFKKDAVDVDKVFLYDYLKMTEMQSKRKKKIKHSDDFEDQVDEYLEKGLEAELGDEDMEELDMDEDDDELDMDEEMDEDEENFEDEEIDEDEGEDEEEELDMLEDSEEGEEHVEDEAEGHLDSEDEDLDVNSDESNSLNQFEEELDVIESDNESVIEGSDEVKKDPFKNKGTFMTLKEFEKAFTELKQSKKAKNTRRRRK